MPCRPSVESIRYAMQDRFPNGDRLLNWHHRQPLNEDPTSPNRAEEFRARQPAQDETQWNATKRNATLRNAM